MALTVFNPSAPAIAVGQSFTQNGGIQGSAPAIQGNNQVIQGSSPNLQGSSPQLQVTANPQTAASLFPSTFATSTPAPAPASIAPTVAPTVYAPKFDTAAVAAQARADAANAVNPYYTATLNKFLAEQARQQQVQQEQTATNVKNYQDSLKEVLAANELTGNRTAADTALKIGDINKTTDQFQQDSGNQFETARLAQARLQAQNGVLGSGAGNRATNTAIITRNTGEARAVDKAQEQKDAAELFKSRTFEDLATASKSATTAEGKQEAQAQFDLNNYIQNLNYQTDVQRDALDKQRQAEIAQQTQTLAKTAYNNYINGIANPAVRVAAAQQYGGSF